MTPIPIIARFGPTPRLVNGEDAAAPPRRTFQALGRLVRRHKTLSLILLSGFLLRVVSILWGIPLLPPVRGYYAADESAVFSQALAFPENYLTNSPYAYGATIPYTVGMLLWPFKELFLSRMHLPEAHELLIVLACRMVSVLAGTAAIWLAYHIAQRFSGKLAGLLGASLLAVSFTHCTNSCYCNLDICISFLLLANFAYLFHVLDAGRTTARNFALLGVLSGILLGTKVTTGVFFLFPVALCGLRYFQERRPDSPTQEPKGLVGWMRLLVVYSGVAFLVYAVSNMHIIVQLPKYIAYMRELKRDWYDSHPLEFVQVLRNWARTTRLAVGTPVALMAFTGLFSGGFGKPAYKLSLVAFVALHYSLYPYYFQPRYVAVVAPIYCVLAGCLCARLWVSGWPAVRIMAGYVTLVALAYCLCSCLSGLYYRFHDPRIEATHFIESSFVPGYTYATGDLYKGNGSWLYPTPDPHDFKKTDLLERPEILMVDRNHFAHMEQVVSQKLIDANYDLTEEGKRFWVPCPEQPLEFFRLYKKLVEGTGEYVLWHTFEPPRALAPEYSSKGLRIYLRRDIALSIGFP